MEERHVGKPWSAEEDALLRHAIDIHGIDCQDWKLFAQYVPGRTNKACRKRWLHSLAPVIKKSAWTAEEDELLVRLFNQHPNRWSVIARGIEGRTDDACSKRYREALDPSLRTGEWTREEDEELIRSFSKHGGRWGLIREDLKRSGLGCRNRLRYLQRRGLDIPLNAEGHAGPSNFSWDFDVPPDFSSHSSYLQDPPPEQNDNNDNPFFASVPSYPVVDGEDGFLHRIDPPPFHYSSSSLSDALSESRPQQTYPQTQTIHGDGSWRPFPYDAIDLHSHSEPAPQLFLDANNGLEWSHAPENSNPSTSEFQEEDGTTLDVHNDSSTPLLSPTPSHTTVGESITTTLSPLPFHDSMSSTSTTPIGLGTLTLSPVSSPQGPSIVNLPPTDDSSRSIPVPVTVPSVQLTPYYPDPTQPPPKTNSQKKRVIEPIGRLSLALPATGDPSIRPYACGHKRCWPADAHTSAACYATAGELLDHSKSVHDSMPGGDTPFRCSLEGCGKSWKNINGVQYHLQISKAHFREAISNTFALPSDLPPAETVRKPAPSAKLTSAEKAERKKNKCYRCPRPDCVKDYRQLSGLRYHLAHVSMPRLCEAQYI
ncbi:hypothetical protein PLICRDRAFT_26811 [Plicaturopsis crispa FD-325 SS-3]|nr:hypothetical protein PLICRDRAFT_26811 [Plicaturopsis crispa FD-325 SS-3]